MSEKTVSVIITVLNDKRIERTIRSILNQTYLPDEIFVADGGSNDGTWELILDFKEKYNDIINPERLNGNIPTTRNKALPLMKGDIIAFIDADEVAPKDWLKSLITPILNGEADMTGGPTRPYSKAQSNVEDYINKHDDFFYENVVAGDITMLPAGNSAYSREIFNKIGNYDSDLKDSEDYDVNIRAEKAGFKGKYVKEAWAYHDQHTINSLMKLIKRKYRYMIGSTVVYFKHDLIRKNAKRSIAKNIKFHHRYELLDFFIKPLAFLRGYLIYRKYEKQSEDKNSESENS